MWTHMDSKLKSKLFLAHSCACSLRFNLFLSARVCLGLARRSWANSADVQILVLTFALKDGPSPNLETIDIVFGETL